MQNKLREAWYIGLFDSLPLLRDPMLLVVVSLFSFLPVFFIFVFAGGAIALPALVGAIVLSLAFVGLFIAQSVYFNKHWFRFQDMLVASPVSPVSYAIGLSISTLLISSPAVVLSFAVLLIALPIGMLEFAAVIAISLLLWIAMVFIGYAIGASTKNTRRANSLPQILGVVLGFLPPVYYSADLLPPLLQPVALLVPTAQAAQLSKYYFGLLPLSGFEVAFGWAYLVAFAVIMGLITIRKAHWVDP